MGSSLSFLLIQLHLRQSGQAAGRAASAGAEPLEPIAGTRALPPAHALRRNASRGDWPGVVGGGANTPGVEAVRQSIEFNNLNAEIRNEARFGPLLGPAGPNVSAVLVVQVHSASSAFPSFVRKVRMQVHDRAKYLAQLVKSLGEAVGIENVLLIFSHDFYSPEINDIIRSIKFCRVGTPVLFRYIASLRSNLSGDANLLSLQHSGLPRPLPGGRSSRLCSGHGQK